MDKSEKRLDLDSELGMSRRDLLRRGAIVGGTLLWVAPAIQSITPAANAADERVGSEQHFCCFCNNSQCLNDGVPKTQTDCDTFCVSVGSTRKEFFGPRSTPYSCTGGGVGCSPKA